MQELEITKDGAVYTLRLSEQLSALPEAAEIRAAVFLDEQGFAVEFDGIDETALHALLLRDGKALGAARIYADADDPQTVHLGRIVLRQSARGCGLGRLLVTALEQAAAARGYVRAVLSAQTRVRGFYESLGYCAEGSIYYEEFCPHIKMTKTLS